MPIFFMLKNKNIPNLGIGIGLRPVHYQDILEKKPDIDWFEIISENYMIDGGKPLEMLDRILENYPVVQHGVSLQVLCLMCVRV